MPFGICSVPEAFQHRMHELIEGLHGIEVIADDFTVVSFGDTFAEASRDHDKNLEAFLHRCKDRGIILNLDKVQLRKQEVPFIVHVATSRGLSINPHKVLVIMEMPQPKDIAAVQRLLGLHQYLSKFLPNLSDITKPLRECTQKDSEWIWDHAQQDTLDTPKKAVSNTPILCYYNLLEEVTLQCDASQIELGAVLMQNGQPVSYTPRALMVTHTP